jgi:hypothetical protein
MDEIWKPCKRNKDYEVSNLGRIRNKQKKILKRKPNISGYIQQFLSNKYDRRQCGGFVWKYTE